MPTEEGGTELYVVMLGSSQKSILVSELYASKWQVLSFSLHFY